MEKEYAKICLNKPTNLIIEDLIKDDSLYVVDLRSTWRKLNWKPTKGKKLKKYIPVMYYFIHELLERQYTKNEHFRDDKDHDYVQMYTRDIAAFKSKDDFKTTRFLLEKFKVIECKIETEPNAYRQSAQAYYFKLTDAYSLSEVVEHEMLVEKRIADKLEEKYALCKKNLYEIKKSNVSTIVTPIHHQLESIRNMRFDADAARLFSRKLLDTEKMDINRFNACTLTINRIVNQRHSFSKSRKCGRFYTTVTMMPRELRRFLLDSDGNPLQELDFASFNGFAVYKILCISKYRPKTTEDQIAYDEEIKFYRKFLTMGDFYTSIKAIVIPEEELTREEIKDIILQRWFNGRPNSLNPYRKKFKERLPVITKIIDLLKVPAYNNFSITAMQMESQLVNEIIYNKFITMHPDAMVYSVFDCLMVNQKYEQELQALMIDEGTKFFGIQCRVKAK
jgi:hypothetical protein